APRRADVLQRPVRVGDDALRLLVQGETPVAARVRQCIELGTVTLPLVVLDSLVEDRATDLSPGDRKSTRLNSSHVKISYAFLCLRLPRPSLLSYTTLFRSRRPVGRMSSSVQSESAMMRCASSSRARPQLRRGSVSASNSAP